MGDLYGRFVWAVPARSMAVTAFLVAHPRRSNGSCDDDDDDRASGEPDRLLSGLRKREREGEGEGGEKERGREREREREREKESEREREKVNWDNIDGYQCWISVMVSRDG